MDDSDRQFPDNSTIHARKARGRGERAALPFSAKLDALDALRDRVEPIVRARKSRHERYSNPKSKT